MSCVLGPLSAGLTTDQNATLSAIAATVAGLTSGTITVSSPVSEGGNLTLTAGDSYLAADGRAINFSSTSWPSLAGATIALTGVSRQSGVNVDFSMAVVQATGPGIVRLELSHDQTVALERGDNVYRFQIIATLADASRTTLVSAAITVK